MTIVNFSQASDVNTNLKLHGIELPVLTAKKNSFVPYVISGNVIYISGQLPTGTGELSKHVGKLGKEFTAGQGKEIARIAALNVVAQLKDALGGDWSRLSKAVKLTVFVNSQDDFTDQPLVANGASEVINQIFGARGAHARSAVGVKQLPLGVAVEVEAIFELKSEMLKNI